MFLPSIDATFFRCRYFVLHPPAWSIRTRQLDSTCATPPALARMLSALALVPKSTAFRLVPCGPPALTVAPHGTGRYREKGTDAASALAGDRNATVPTATRVA